MFQFLLLIIAVGLLLPGAVLMLREITKHGFGKALPVEAQKRFNLGIGLAASGAIFMVLFNAFGG